MHITQWLAADLSWFASIHLHHHQRLPTYLPDHNVSTSSRNRLCSWAILAFWLQHPRDGVKSPHNGRRPRNISAFCSTHCGRSAALWWRHFRVGTLLREFDVLRNKVQGKWRRRMEWLRTGIAGNNLKFKKFLIPKKPCEQHQSWQKWALTRQMTWRISAHPRKNPAVRTASSNRRGCKPSWHGTIAIPLPVPMGPGNAAPTLPNHHSCNWSGECWPALAANGRTMCANLLRIELSPSQGTH